jgi:hypothetical protein
LPIHYPTEIAFSMSPTVLEPWWGAWHPVIYLGIFLLTTVVLMIVWICLSLLYTLPVRLIAYYEDRELTIPGAWRLSSVALMPGALTMLLAICLYGWHVLDLIGLGAIVPLHLLMGWVYLVFSPTRIKRISLSKDVFRSNPFATAEQ